MVHAGAVKRISRNWAGVPLRTWDTILAFIQGTTTSSGLTVRALFQPGQYPTGVKVSDTEKDALNLERHIVCPVWDYTIRPRSPFPFHRDSGNLFFDATLVQ